MKLSTKTLALAALFSTGAAFAQSDYCIFQVDDYYPGPTGSNPYQMVEFNGDIYFGGFDPSAGGELLKYDGSTISLVQDIRPGALASQPNGLVVMNGIMYFAAHDGTNGTELYQYDGVTASLAADVNTGIFHSYPAELTVVGDKLYFTADDGSTGTELYVFDGTFTTQVADINPGIAPSLPLKLFEHNGNLYFQADNGTDGRELYEYDGTTLSTWDLNPTGDSNPSFFYDWNGQLVFSATDGASGMELFEFNSGSPVLTEIAPGGPNGNPTQFATFQGDLYFRASTLANGAELYMYDGSTVTMVEDLNVGSFHSNPDNITTFGTELLFTANDGNTGYELWRYDGSTVSLVQQINPGSGSAFNAFNAQPFIVAGTGFYFLADNGTNGEEWWHYDGISCNLTKDLNSGGASCNAIEPAVFGSNVYFTATNGSDGEELHRITTDAVLVDSVIVATCGSWVSPGGQSFSGNGTFQVTDIIPSVSCPGCDSLVYTDLTITDDTLFIQYDVISCGTWISPAGVPYNTVGTYFVEETFNSVLCPGSDSIHQVNLEIVQLSTSVVAFGDVLVAQANGATYQWLDCDNGYAFIPGATNQDFTPADTGNYAVAVSIGGCVDTSACYLVEPSGSGGGGNIGENALDAFVKIFPNPAQDQIRISTELAGDYSVKIMDQAGKVVASMYATDQTIYMDLNELATGMYIVEIRNEDGRAVKKLLVQ